MDYKENVETAGLQDLRNVLQNPFVVVGGTLLLIAMWSVWTAALVGVVGYVIVRMYEQKRLAEEARARAAAYRNICCPQVICSQHPNEPVASVQARADAFRQALVDSGNPYAAVIPVIAYPFSPMISSDETLFTAWDYYRRECGAELHRVTLEWVDSKCPAQLKGIVLSQVLQRPQTPVENG